VWRGAEVYGRVGCNLYQPPKAVRTTGTERESTCRFRTRRTHVIITNVNTDYNSCLSMSYVQLVPVAVVDTSCRQCVHASAINLYRHTHTAIDRVDSDEVIATVRVRVQHKIVLHTHRCECGYPPTALTVAN
jgi:hypothetical protein